MSEYETFYRLKGKMTDYLTDEVLHKPSPRHHGTDPRCLTVFPDNETPEQKAEKLTILISQMMDEATQNHKQPSTKFTELSTKFHTELEKIKAMTE